jgi:hypothetical protein
MVSQGETDTGFCLWFSGAIAGYTGHLLGNAFAQMMTGPMIVLSFKLVFGPYQPRDPG